MPVVEDWDDPITDSRHVAVTVGEDRFERVFKRRDILEYGDLRTASRFWKHGDRLATLNDHVAAVTMHALAIETLFPALADRLPS